MICGFGIGEEDENEKMWKVLRNTLLASCQNGISNSQLAHSAHDESCCVWVQVAGVSYHSTIWSKLVRCCLCVYRDKQMFSTAEIS